MSPKTASADTVALTIDDRAVTVPRGTSIWQAAREAGIDIPVLCHSPRLPPVGVCRVCVVDIGERVLAAACVRPCEEGMAVQTHTPEVETHRKTLLELLLADYPEPVTPAAQAKDANGGDELLALARAYSIATIPYPDGTGAGEAGGRGSDVSSAVIAVDHQACILCDRCLRGCDDLQHNDVLGRTGKGYTARIAFDLNQPMGQSTCVSCGECMAVCPTGALTNKTIAGLKLERG